MALWTHIWQNKANKISHYNRTCLCLSGVFWKARGRFTVEKTHDIANLLSCYMLMNVLFVKVVKGVTVWGRSISSPFLRMTLRYNRFWQQPLWLFFLPPVSHCSLFLDKHIACHISTGFPVSWVGKVKNKYKNKAGQPLPLCLPCGVPVVISHTWHEAGNEDRRSRMTGHSQHPLIEQRFNRSSDKSIIPWIWWREVGLENKSQLFACMSAASPHFASSLSFSIHREVIWN